MTIYSLYIFDRHCDCVYYQDWHRITPIRPGKDVLPGVAPGTSLADAHGSEERQLPSQQQQQSRFTPSSAALPRNPSQSSRQDAASQSNLGPVRAPTVTTGPDSASQQQQAQPNTGASASAGLPFDEESKLVYGVIFSLRNMVKKLSMKDDEAFIAYRTSTYKIHLFETPSGLKFVLFSDPSVESLRFILKSIYQSAYIEFVVRNPMVGMDSRESKRGIDNLAFRTAVNNFISSLSVFR